MKLSDIEEPMNKVKWILDKIPRLITKKKMNGTHQGQIFDTDLVLNVTMALNLLEHHLFESCYYLLAK